MNCHPDHTPLTAADMEAIALDAGLITIDGLDRAHAVHEKAAMFLDFISNLTRDVRLAMMDTGELTLHTTVFVAVPKPPITIDPFFLTPAIT